MHIPWNLYYRPIYWITESKTDMSIHIYIQYSDRIEAALPLYGILRCTSRRLYTCYQPPLCWNYVRPICFGKAIGKVVSLLPYFFFPQLHYEENHLTSSCSVTRWCERNETAIGWSGFGIAHQRMQRAKRQRAISFKNRTLPAMFVRLLIETRRKAKMGEQ